MWYETGCLDTYSDWAMTQHLLDHSFTAIYAVVWMLCIVLVYPLIHIHAHTLKGLMLI
jgi:alcohol dehydrogenase YqhD (iron-dependent ADH family)